MNFNYLTDFMTVESKTASGWVPAITTSDIAKARDAYLELKTQGDIVRVTKTVVAVLISEDEAI